EMVQLPQEGGTSACSIRLSEIVSVITSPPVVVRNPPPPDPPPAPRPAVLAAAPVRPPHCAVLDDFLNPDEHREMLDFALACEDQFERATVVTREPGYRTNRVILEFGHSEHAR